MILAPPHAFQTERRAWPWCSVSPLYFGDEAIGMHSTGYTGLSQAAGLWRRENYTKARLKDLVS